MSLKISLRSSIYLSMKLSSVEHRNLLRTLAVKLDTLLGWYFPTPNPQSELDRKWVLFTKIDTRVARGTNWRLFSLDASQQGILTSNGTVASPVNLLPWKKSPVKTNWNNNQFMLGKNSTFETFSGPLAVSAPNAYTKKPSPNVKSPAWQYNNLLGKQLQKLGTTFVDLTWWWWWWWQLMLNCETDEIWWWMMKK